MVANEMSDSTVFPINGVSLKLVQQGAGPTLLLLHGTDGLRIETPFVDLLAQHMHVLAPTHPGFSGTELPDWIDNIDDLVYLYLDVMDRFDLKDVTLVGFSIGGWIAAEMAVRCTHRIARLVLAAAIGIKVGDRETRDIPDIWALHPNDVHKLLWHKPELSSDLSKMTDEQLAQIALDQEAAALFLWEPYMHNPRLKRQLHRIDVPTLVLRGAHDGLISQSYAESYVAAIPGAKLEIINEAAHVLDVEQPTAVANQILRFVGLA